MTYYISGAAYVCLSYALRLVIYCAVFMAVYVVLLCLALEDKSFSWWASEKHTDSSETITMALPEKVNL